MTELLEEIETLPNYTIKWRGNVFPINSELWDEWTLSKKVFDYPELLVPVRIIYVPDDEFEKQHRTELLQYKPRWWQMWKFPLFWWQFYRTRAISYRGRIYIKESARMDRALLLHELGHTVVFLDHSPMVMPGIMNPISSLWMVDQRKLR